MPNELLQSALLYASIGWPVFPLNYVEKDGTCSCHSPKCNAAGKHPITTNGLKDASTDPKTIQNWWTSFPNANIGLVTGAKPGFIVLDIDPRHGGDQTLLDLEMVEGKLPETLVSLTGGGGQHLFFKHPGGRVQNDQSGKSLGLGIDVRADGGYVVAPPSNHISGNEYMWEASCEPTMPIEPCPQWIVGRLNRQGGGTAKTSKAKTKTNGSQKIQSGRRNSALTSYAGLLRRNGMDELQILAALKTYNQLKCNPPLSDTEVETIAKSISQYSGNAPDDDDICMLWLDTHPNTAYGLGQFQRYADGIWTPIHEYKVEAEIQDFLIQFKGSGMKVTHNKVTSIKSLARGRCMVEDTVWNADPDLVVCKNGTINTRTNTLGAHDAAYHITSRLPFEYDENAYAPSWLHYLDSLHPDIVSFLQEFAGYCLTSDTSLETAVWLYGQPGTGKSTYVTGLLTVLGDRAGLLGLHDIERSQFSLGSLPGKSLVYSTEQPNDFISVTHVLNAIISGEPINIQRKYKDEFTLIPHAKLLWAMNETPRVSDASNGLFRRVHIVPFQKLSGPADTKLKEAITLEGSGIMLWALEGLTRLRARGGFAIPKIIKDATERYKLDNDIPRLFVSDQCEVDPTFEILGSTLYTNYRTWCIENGYKPMASNTVSKAWERIGFTSKHTKKGNYWQGIQLRSNIP